MGKRSSVPRLVGDVLRYFVRHPRAADTAEGVARWRLLQLRVERDLRDTRRALAWLEAQDLLRARRGPGVSGLFTLAPERRARAARVLAELERASYSRRRRPAH